MTDVSVVVPVYNPGANVEDLLRSLDAQTLPHDRFEAILVDDGSTDGTGERLDAWAAERPWAHVEHIPNSGWPGRPRNVGTDRARGEYVLYVDNDDHLDPEALQRLVERARADDADVVVGKVVGHGKTVPRELFRRNRTGVTLDWPPLLRLLSPHKLFRRALLTEHGIRFPEGRRRLEDHVVVMHAYFVARRISVLADHPIYHWMRRDEGNQSFAKMDPVAYFRRDVPMVLDVIDAHTEPGEQRDVLYTHWFRSKALWRVQGGAYVRRDPAFNAEILAEVRRLVLERFPERLDRHLPFSLRVLAALVRLDRPAGVLALAEHEAGLRLRLRLNERGPAEEGGERLVYGARFGGTGLRFRTAGERTWWAPPPGLAGHLDGVDLEVTDDLAPHSDVLLRDPEGVEHVVPSRRSLRLEDAEGGLAPVVRVVGRVDPETAAGGARLREGRWDVAVLIRLAGFSASAAKARVVDGRGRLGETREPVRVEVGAAPAPAGLLGRLKRRR